MTSDVVPIGTDPRPLYRPWNRQRVITDIAEGRMTQAEIGRKYGVTQPSISDFIDRHYDEITDRRQHLQDQFHGLWIADKAARVGVLQQQAEGAEELMAMALAMAREAARRGVTVAELIEGAEEDQHGGVSNDLVKLETEQDKMAAAAMANFLKLQKSQREAMRGAAEELAQLPNRPTVSIQTERIEHVYVGVEMDDV